MNLFDDDGGLPVDERFDTLFARPGLRIERIVSAGHVTPAGQWYDQPQDEWVIVIEGAARLELEGSEVSLARGDHCHIPAHVRHRVSWTDPERRTLWLAVHFD